MEAEGRGPVGGRERPDVRPRLGAIRPLPVGLVTRAHRRAHLHVVDAGRHVPGVLGLPADDEAGAPWRQTGAVGE